MKPLNIFHIASECVPYSKTGGLADVVGALPSALAQLGHNVHVVIPAYKETLKKTGNPVNTWDIDIGPVGSGMEGSVLEIEPYNGVKIYLVNNEEYFNREYLYGTPEGDYPDNLDRFTFFCRAVLEILPELCNRPDILHCHDWQTSLIPLYIKSSYGNNEYYKTLKTVLTIHNLGYQGLFPMKEFSKLGIPETYYAIDGIEYYQKINLLKGGILYSDKITTVSKKYSQEIQTEEYGCGLEGVLTGRHRDLTGIVNGIDYSIWNPVDDPYIASSYTVENLEGKKECKRLLLEKLDLPPRMRVPVIAVISRLADQKGFDILTEIFKDLMSMNIFFILLGTGDIEYHEIFEKLKTRYRKKTGITIAFDNELAHQIEAGADMFLMPSKYEPCGLNQMISLKYGTVPIVRATGGLDDTIQDFTEDPARGNGFKFEEYSGNALLRKIREAVLVYREEETWNMLQKRGMLQDFSWKFAASQYARIYEQLLH